jgi:predicted RND superfamily exporter protein
MWVKACLTYRKTVLTVLAAITAVAAVQIPHVHFNNAIETWFVEGDASLRNHQRLLDTFGSDTIIVVGIEAPDVFAPDLLAKIDRATRAIETTRNVEKVFSLTSVEAITGKPDDLIEVSHLVEFPLDDASLRSIRDRALTDDLYVGNVVSADGSFTAIVVRLEHHPGGFDYKIDAVKDVRAILEREVGDGYYLAGGPAFDEQFFYQSEADSIRMMFLMLALLVVILWMLLRTVWGVVLPIVTVSVAILWTIAAMVLTGVRINIITTMLPPLLLAVGVADVTHMLVEYQNRCRAGVAKMPALRGSFEELFGPLFVTACTTALGMLSLTVSRIEAIREFGIFAAAGVVFAFLLTVTFVPVVLSYRPAPPAGAPNPRRNRFISTRALEALHRFNMARSHTILAVWVAVLAVAIGLATRVSAESSFLKIFKESAKVRQDTERIQDELGGTVTIDVMIDTGRPDGVKDPAVLQRLAALEEFLKSQPDVSTALSVAGYFKSMRRAFHGNDPSEHRLPVTREEAAQYLLLYEMDAPDGEIGDFVTLDYSQARVTARANMKSSNSAAALAQATEEYIKKNFPPGLKGTVSGLLVMYADLEEYIRNSLIQGFSVALLSIFVVFCLQMRSVGLGTIMMIANCMPIVITLAVMGLFGIHLDSMTAMVASVAIGLADDDSIHFMSRVRSKLDAGIAVTTALRDAVVEVGRALVYSGLALCAGFAVMLTASFLVAIYFGLLVMLTIIISLAADLVLLPVMLRYYESWRRGMPAVGRLARDVVVE